MMLWFNMPILGGKTSCEQLLVILMEITAIQGDKNKGRSA